MNTRFICIVDRLLSSVYCSSMRCISCLILLSVCVSCAVNIEPRGLTNINQLGSVPIANLQPPIAGSVEILSIRPARRFTPIYVMNLHKKVPTIPMNNKVADQLIDVFMSGGNVDDGKGQLDGFARPQGSLPELPSVQAELSTILFPYEPVRTDSMFLN